MNNQNNDALDPFNIANRAEEHPKRDLRRLMSSRVGHYFTGFVAGCFVVSLIGAVVMNYVNTKPSTPTINFALANSAAPSASPLVYGTNLSMDNSQDQFLTNSGAASALQGLHAQLIRMPIRSSLTSADYTTALNKIKQIGATPLLIVNGATYSGGDPYPTDSALLTIAKSIFPSQTVYVDFGNEEDLAGASVQTYVSGTYGWNIEIPKLKQITGTNFKYGGPVNFQYNESYIDTFVATATPSPDYIVWHAYAGSCGHNTGTGTPDSQSKMLASVDNWSSHIQQISNDFTIQNGGAHKGMPIIIDEWNYASDLGVSGSASPCYSSDQTFINTFFDKALNMFLGSGKYGLIGAAEYEGFVGKDESMLDGGNTPTLQGQAFKTSYETNFGSAPTPPPPTPTPTYSCSGLSGAPTSSNPLAYAFTANALVANGATLNSADFNYGDGTTATAIQPSSLSVNASHTYAKAGTYSVSATLHFAAANTAVTASCATQVVASTQSSSPAYSGTLSASASSSNAYSYTFTGKTTSNGGASFNNVSISYGDGQSDNNIKPASSQTSIQVSHIYAKNGTYTATATFDFLVSGTIKATMATTQVTVNVGSTPTPTSGSNLLAQDTFARSNQSNWGTASDGTVWSGDANGQSSIFSIKNNVALISNTSNSYTGVIGPVVANSQIVFTGRINEFANSTANYGGVLRYTDSNNWYKGYINGSNLVLQKRVNGNYTTIKSVSFKANENQNYSIRFQADGNTLAVKAWSVNSAEPADWNITATDDSLQSGYDGLRALPQTGNVVGYYYYNEYKL